MPSINDLTLFDEDIPEVTPDDMPAQIGLRTPLPQPGSYKFRLPDSFDYETYQTDKGQRLKAIFRDETAIVLTKTGSPLRYYSINNSERDVKGRLVSDFAYLLKALGHTGPLKGLSAYGNELDKNAGKTFTADLLWTATCNPKREVYKDGEVQKGVFGCGKRFGLQAYSRNGKEVFAIPRDEEGRFADRFECSCGAIVSAFPQLSNFRA